MSTSPFPSGPIQALRGHALVLPGDDIDTDRIIPARYLKCVTFDGLVDGVFADDRAERAGDHPFDRPEQRGASILVVNRNFGCGSSREHAPQALMRWGIRAVIGESFAEIFFGNCLALGIPCLTADHDAVLALQAAIAADPGTVLQLDLDPPRVTLSGDGSSRVWPLGLPAGPARMLVSGEWNGTAQLVAHDNELRATVARLPYMAGFT
ncbi:3-isopropylmalate dehydratase small subunit 2 [Synechococcus sp. CCY 9618]|uniref:3-isopropylmalate dehydratase small subunit n=1 Tax=Synechococcus sp. CCY 9618 TaxID=2815602 RepID=UPI001C217876|nr:isopropylmalate isomerase [Synechococcus sp. CCY 9618]